MLKRVKDITSDTPNGGRQHLELQTLNLHHITRNTFTIMLSLLLETYPGLQTEHSLPMKVWLFILNNPNVTLLLLHVVVIILACILYKVVKYHG